MNMEKISQAGKVKPVLLFWALGVPLPLILLVWLFARGC